MNGLGRGVVVAAGSLLGALLVAWLIAPGLVTVGGVPLSVAVVGLAYAINLIAWIPASIWKTEHFYDLTGSLTYLAVIVLTLAAAPLSPRGVLVGSMVVIWALRLGTFLFLRVRTAGKDRRFDQLKSTPGRFLVPWALQALWATLTTLAAVIQVGAASPGPLGMVDAVGAALWAVGFGVEVVADRQKSAFRAVPEHRDRFIDTGLWSWSRHPNYFGEILLWTGIFIGGAGTYQGAGWLAVISPIFVAALLLGGSGVPILEAQARQRWGNDPRWQAYMLRTSRLMPWPPRRAD